MQEQEVRKRLNEHGATLGMFYAKVGDSLDVASLKPQALRRMQLVVTFESRVVERHASETKPAKAPAVDPVAEREALFANPWRVPVAEPANLSDGHYSLSFEELAYFGPCTVSDGKNDRLCEHCAGTGSKRCLTCGGDGIIGEGKSRRTCSACRGMGTVGCDFCRYTGLVRCEHCNSEGMAWILPKLQVRWSDRRLIEAVGVTSLPAEQLQTAAAASEFIGTPQEYLETGGKPSSQALQHFRASAMVDDEAIRALQELQLKVKPLETERVIRSKLTVDVVPVIEVRYRNGAAEADAWVYGVDQRVFAPNLPISTQGFLMAVGGVLVAVGSVLVTVLAR